MQSFPHEPGRHNDRRFHHYYHLYQQEISPNTLFFKCTLEHAYSGHDTNIAHSFFFPPLWFVQCTRSSHMCFELFCTNQFVHKVATLATAVSQLEKKLNENNNKLSQQKQYRLLNWQAIDWLKYISDSLTNTRNFYFSKLLERKSTDSGQGWILMSVQLFRVHLMDFIITGSDCIHVKRSNDSVKNKQTAWQTHFWIFPS